MITGNLKSIDLSTSSFQRMIEKGNLYIDKTRMIENFLNESSSVQLITRQRRLGKSLNMDTLKCFLTDKKDNRRLFKGLYIENSPAWEKANSAPVFYFDFKGLNTETYKKSIYFMIVEYIKNYCDEKNIPEAVQEYILNKNYGDTDGLLHLTKSVYQATGKRSYILIDEYDKMMMDNYKSDKYDEIRKYETLLFSAGFKGNEYLEKALLTGVMRISRESLFSGLNNIDVFDIFNDSAYTEDYGFTEAEIDELQAAAGFDKDELKSWYNGIMINGQAIYNTYSTTNYLKSGEYKCYWTMSGVMDIIAGLLNEERRKTLAKLLNGETVTETVEERISVADLSRDSGDEDFYSLLAQAGYLSVKKTLAGGDKMELAIPNTELTLAWKKFVLKQEFKASSRYLRGLFENGGDAGKFAEDLERVLGDRLSYHDLAALQGADGRKAVEILYHVFLLGLLCADGHTRRKYPVSNRESGDGRFDICVEREEGSYIFELKASESAENLEKDAAAAMGQISAKRYGAELSGRVVKTGMAFFGKRCKVICVEGQCCAGDRG